MQLGNFCIIEFRYPDKPIETAPSVVAGLQTHDWIVQPKFDGWRTGIYLTNNEVSFITRVGNDLRNKIKSVQIPDSFAQIILSMNLPQQTVLDAEFIEPHTKNSCKLIIFDCLAWSGEWLNKMPFISRWNLCTNIKIPDNDQVKLSEIYKDNFLSTFNKLKKKWIDNNKPKNHLFEGIVLRRKTGNLILSPRSCSKSPCMLKLKFRDRGQIRF